MRAEVIEEAPAFLFLPLFTGVREVEFCELRHYGVLRSAHSPVLHREVPEEPTGPGPG